jgi:hypothetical protein
VFVSSPLARAASRESSMDAASNKDVLRRVYEELVNAQRLDLLDDYFSPDYVNRKTPGGREGTKQLFGMLLPRFRTCRCRLTACAPRETGSRFESRCAARTGEHSWGGLVPVRPLRPRPLTKCG